MRWLAIGGARAWKPTRSPPLSGKLSRSARQARFSLPWRPRRLAISAPRGSRAHLRDQLHDQRSARHCRGACSGDDHDTFCSPLYQTVTTVLLAYVMMFLPRALISLRASLAQAPVELEEVARSLGRSPARALWGGTLRLAAPGAAAGAAMVFLGVVNELTATLLLAPNGTETLATSFWAFSGKLDYAAAAPYATIMVALSLPLPGCSIANRGAWQGGERARTFKSLEILWLGSGRRRCGSHRDDWQPSRHRGTVRLRQDDVASPNRRVRAAERRPHPARRPDDRE